MAPTSALSPDAFGYIVRHVILPPRLPQSCDFNHSHERELLCAVLDAMEKFKVLRHSPLDFQRAIDMVRTMVSCRDGAFLNPGEVRGALKNLSEGGCIAFELRSQNFGVLIHRGQDIVRFEQFELLARNQDVMACKGRLLRRFPGSCVELDYSQFREPRFQSALVDLLVELDRDTHPTCRPKVNKGGKAQEEERDTIDPRLLGLMTGILRGLGRQGCSTQIMKHSREEVLWADARVAWHRSASWIFLRVCLRLVLDRGCESVQACLYKEFMAFLIGELLQQGLSMDIPSHLLFSIVAKANRRFFKLSSVFTRSPGWIAVSHDVVKRAGSKLLARWTAVQDGNRRTLDLEALKSLDFRTDTALSLTKLKPYLQWISDFNCHMDHDGVASLESWFTFRKADPNYLPKLKDIGALGLYTQCYFLADFENWVAEHLQRWLEGHISETGTCENLTSLLQDYYKAAHNVYSGNPVNLSIMWLIIMELWIACDRSVTNLYPLLEDHLIGFPEGLMEPLLMPTKSYMERLSGVEDYLAHRDSRATGEFPLALQGFGSEHSFAARFYETSEQHQLLYHSILSQAEKDRAEKLEELRSKKRAYDSLKSRHESTPHRLIEVRGRRGYTRMVCASNCLKCSLEQEMQNMRISVHEWPLPKGSLYAKSVVFELQVPGPIIAWRQATMMLFVDMLKDPKDRAMPTSVANLYHAFDYPDLSPHVRGRQTSPLQLASPTKPFTKAHYRDRPVSEANEQNICQNHGCQYDYYDYEHGALLSRLLNDLAIPQELSFSCLSSFVIPQWIGDYGHSSNEIIAKQVLCPSNWALDEFKAFGHLRSGVRLQWRNILTQLTIPSLNFNKVDTAYLVIQAIYEAGPAKDNERSTYRDAHGVLRDEYFTNSLIKAMKNALDRVEENWECDTVLLILVVLCTNLLSHSPSNRTHQKCLGFLARIRSISKRWVDQLLNQRATSDSESERNDLDIRILGMALICVRTFDVEPTHLNCIFFVDEADTCFIETSIIINDHTPPSVTLLPWVFISLQLWRRLSYQALPIILARIRSSRYILDKAITTFWADYTPGTSWSFVGCDHHHVLTSQSATTAASRGLSVSLNLLDGSLLVNGKPLSRLPKEFQDHPTYTRLFGSQILEIVPSGLPSMDFSAARKQNGWVVHFAMVEKKLIIRACKNESTWEFIPPSEIVDDFPTALINSHSHWVNMASSELEFRSFSEPWKSQGEIWRMFHQNGQWFLHKGNQALIDQRSDTAKILGDIFKPIENARHINLILDQTSGRLEVKLPRYDLSFTLETHDCVLRSKHYPGMCVDKDQSFHTLVGLSSRIVLRPEDLNANTMRAILIPHGAVICTKGDNDHPITTIYPPADVSYINPGYPVIIPRRRHHCFRIDEDLGRLVDNGSLQSKLLQCHLHAVTSHCLPDELTGITGTEEALRILKSAAIVSFDRLEDEDIRMLSEIATLSPRRKFYPSHLKAMQTVKWSNSLDPIAQSDEFSRTVRSILNHGASCEMFFPNDPAKVPELTITDAHLQERALIRCSTFRVSGYGAERHTASFDTNYHGRDTVEGPILHLEQRVCQLTKVLYMEKPVKLETISSTLIETIYKIMGDRVVGPGSQPITETHRFDIQWLDNPVNSIGENWCRIQRSLCSTNLSESKYGLMTFFGALVFADHADVQIIQTLLAFTSAPALRCLSQPEYPEFSLKDGHSYLKHTLAGCMEKEKRNMAYTPSESLPRRDGELDYDLWQRRRSDWESKVSSIMSEVLLALERQWPTAHPFTPNVDGVSKYFDTESVMAQVRQHYVSWERNRQLHLHLKTVVSIMIGLETDQGSASEYDVIGNRLDPLVSCSGPAYIPITQLLAHKPPNIVCEPPPRFDHCYSHVVTETSTSTINEGNRRLPSLLSSLRTRASRVHERDYVDELDRSLRSYQLNLGVDTRDQLIHDNSTLRFMMENYAETCRRQVSHFQRVILLYLRGMEHEFDMAVSCYCFPRLTPMFILQQLNRHNWSNLSIGWQRCFVAYCLALTHLQRSKRLLAAVGNTNQLLQEMKNVGHTWDPMSLPESLLLEVESGLMIREVQEQIAAQMRNPDHNLNSVMQLNMGEGKSSVIVQIVAARLADGNKLVRIIVAKPQSKQMRHMLVTKLGGLLDRQLFFMPFSRSIIMDAPKVEQIRRTLTKCIENGGVLLVQPEHLLSFKLMGIEYVGCCPTQTSNPPVETNGPTETTSIISGKRESRSTGVQLIELQKFLDQSSRDVMDESDENFNVKFELIYTIGSQSPVEMSPDRWIIIQNVLSLLYQCASNIQDIAPDGIHLEPGKTGQFATLRIIKESVGDMLLQTVVHQLCEKGVHGLPVAHQPPATRQIVRNYILDEELTHNNSVLVENDDKGFFCRATKGTLLLLRGLFAGGVLRFALSQKRWRVNYGLTERNPPTLVAVPYRAKDSPAPRAEFSHPDIVIILTCLSYYYGGLSNDELFTTFEHLQRSDQSDDEFASWVKSSAKLPPAFCQLSGINLKDRAQCTKQIFPVLKFTKVVIDFYLDKVVFPKEMVEFPKKLSASGWDLAKVKPHPVTGFSGTCDSKYVLPLEVKHLDLPDQIHTNAMVLNCLLRPENIVRELGPNLSSTSLVESAVHSEPPIQVILDVGALIVELGNEQVARMWLDLTSAHDKQAAIFFSDTDELLVINREGFIEPFLTSPFVGDTKDCLVFLDEAHTRGTDLRLPDDYRAAVTLGPRLTKDRLVQACMRMRKLGKGQSITFFIPQEIQERIRACTSLNADAPLTVHDVLLWSISETWVDTEKSIPLWAMQGFRHQRQETIWNEKIASEPRLALDSRDLKGYFEDEALSLEKRYLPSPQTSSLDFSIHTPEYSADRKEHVDGIRARCERFQIASFGSATLSEEQERELAPEVEQERQSEKPNPTEPKKHTVHPDLLKLIQRGTLDLSRGGFLAAFESFRRSTAGLLVDTKEFGEDLLVTTDFVNTVNLTPGSNSDTFHRPVQWVLTLKEQAINDRSVLVVLSPWEANELVIEIGKSNYVHLHSYAARPNLSFPTLQDLKLCVMPPLPADWIPPSKPLILQLNIFAGQLYFENLCEYKEACAFLGLSCIPNDGTIMAGVDGFIGRGVTYPECRFTQSPTAFLRVVMSNIRRECQDIGKTHVGRMLAGEILTEKDFPATAD